MVNEYTVIFIMLALFLVSFINFILRGFLKVHFANPYWITLVNYYYFFLIYTCIEVGMFLNFFVLKWDETKGSRLAFNIMLFIIVYSLSLWICLYFYKAFKSTKIYKFDIVLNKNLKYIVIYTPLLNTILFTLFYTTLCIHKEWINKKFNEVFN